jgi:hypothetical protein
VTASIDAGDTFFIDLGSRAGVQHLWVVLAVYDTDASYEQMAALVSVTTMTARADRTCILRPDDGDRHDFVTHESYVFYGGIIEVEVRELLALPADKRRARVCPALLRRMRAGLHRSPHTRRGFKPKVPQT